MSHLCIDIGATKVYIGVLETEFQDISRVDTDEFLERSDEILEEILKVQDIEKTAVALPGPLDLERGEIYPPNLPYERIDIDSIFERYTSDVTYLNDCHAGVIGEYIYGEVTSENIVYLTISTGVGAGVISDGKVMKGGNGNFAEVGHMIIGGDRRCGCGGKGHWEAYCSGSNIIDYAEELTGVSYESPKDLFERFKKGDEKAEKVVKRFQRINAKGVSNIINMYNPEVIVIGGSLAVNNPDVILGEHMGIVKSEAINPVPDIRVTNLKEYSVLYGLKAISFDEFEY